MAMKKSIIITLCVVKLVFVSGFEVDICQSHMKRIHVPVGQSGFITARNVNYSELENYSKCNLELITCASCIIKLFVKILDPLKCGNYEMSVVRNKECKCDRLEIREPIQKVFFRKSYCKSSLKMDEEAEVYSSQSRTVGLLFQFSQSYDRPFMVQYKAIYNIQSIDLYVKDSVVGTIKTAFFPLHYPSDLRIRYNIKCIPHNYERCRIKLIFLDHQIAPQSLLEFTESRGRRIGISTGKLFRPPIIVSDGPILLVNFYANRATSFGFKANYSAVVGDISKSSIIPKTTCGGFVENHGGVIKMENMVNEETEFYDCIWIIRPVQRYLNTRSNLYIKIISFSNMGFGSVLEIHKGPTSSHKLLEKISQNNVDCKNETCSTHSDGHVVSINTDIYISLRAYFKKYSQVSIIYATYSLAEMHELVTSSSDSLPTQIYECHQISDFQCQNHRCIPNNFQCDGYDHCGDNSDEMDHCYQGDMKEFRLYSNNYYFPNKDMGNEFSVGYMIILFTVIVSLLLCSLFCMLIYKLNYQNEIDNHLRTYSQLLVVPRDANPTNEVNEPPPQYDHPPTYIEATEFKRRMDVKLETITAGCSNVAECSNNNILHENIRNLLNVDNNSSSDESEPSDLVLLSRILKDRRKSRFRINQNIEIENHSCSDNLIYTTCFYEIDSDDSENRWSSQRKRNRRFSNDKFKTVFVSSANSLRCDSTSNFGNTYSHSYNSLFNDN